MTVQEAVAYLKAGHTDVRPLRELTKAQLQDVLVSVRWGYDTPPQTQGAVKNLYNDAV